MRITPRERRLLRSATSKLSEAIEIAPVEMEIVDHVLPMVRDTTCLLGLYVRETKRARVYVANCDVNNPPLMTVVHEFGHHAWYETEDMKLLADFTMIRMLDERPPSPYACTDVYEDLCESFAEFVIRPAEFSLMCPNRYGALQDSRLASAEGVLA